MTDLPEVRAALLAWYTAHARALPWRKRPGERADPYRVWVSEIMLQQTRVETVLRYYDDFIERFPDAETLAAAPEDDVMAAWSGLGYYRRARLLHAGVREVVARYGGRVPEAPEARRALPGIGRYTAGAIGSIAFQRPEPIVDGNVMRVFARLFRIETPLDHRDTQARMWAKAEALVPGERPGDLNQALMELGARVCTKGQPACERCPLAERCAGRAAGVEAQLPVPKAKRPPRPLSLAAVLATSEGGRRVWLQRGEGSLFGGLWNLPMHPGADREAAKRAGRGAGLSVRLDAEPRAHFEHVLTHRHLRITLFTGTVRGERKAAPREAGGAVSSAAAPRAVDGAELAELGISSLTRKGLRLGGFI